MRRLSAKRSVELQQYRQITVPRILRRDRARCQYPIDIQHNKICGSREAMSPHHLYGRYGDLLLKEAWIIMLCGKHHRQAQGQDLERVTLLGWQIRRGIIPRWD